MKKTYVAILLTLLFFSSSSISVAAPQAALKKVLIIQTVDHPALNATTGGIIAGLAAAGYSKDKNLEIRVESAQASYAVAAQIASKFVHQNPDVVVGVGTISAQVFSKYAANKQTQLVFSSVTDPLSAKLVKSIKSPGNNTSGVSNFVALEPQLQLFKHLQPKLKRLGIIYNPAELNSISIVQQLEPLCTRNSIVLVKQAVAKTSDVAQNAIKLAGQVDAIFISNDNTALSSLQSVIRAGNNTKIPVYVSDTDAVALGAVAALGPNQREVGRQTGTMIAKILDGTKIDSLPIEFPDKTDLVINLGAAKAANIEVPADLLTKAHTIIEEQN